MVLHRERLALKRVTRFKGIGVAPEGVRLNIRGQCHVLFAGSRYPLLLVGLYWLRIWSAVAELVDANVGK